MTEENRRRAEQVAQDPEVQRWIKRFKRLARDMPKEVWVYVSDHAPNVMVRNEEGGHCVSGPKQSESVDQDGVIESLPAGGWEGGGW